MDNKEKKKTQPKRPKQDEYTILFSNKMIYLRDLYFKETDEYTQKAFVEKVLKNAVVEQEFSEYINGYRTPNISTLYKILNKIREYPLFKDIPADFFFTKSNNITSTSINIGKVTGLNDATIQNIKSINTKDNTTLNSFINDIDKDFWKKLYDLKIFMKIDKLLNDIFMKYNDCLSESLLTNKEIFVRFSDNINIIKNIEMLKQYNNIFPEITTIEEEKNKEKALEKIKNLLDKYNIEETLFSTLLVLRAKINEVTNYDLIIDNEKLIDKLRKNYCTNLVRYIKEISSIFENFKKDFLCILEYDFIENYINSVVSNLFNFAEEDIVITRELWEDLCFSISSKVKHEILRLKYQISEYLTLYMNK